jgi:hypothetical protein
MASGDGRGARGIWEGDPARIKKLNWWRAVATSADTFERIE